MRRRLTRDESRVATRQAVMDAAEGLFIERGYRGASLDEIAEAAGYSKGAVYSNFESKGDLFLALLDRRAASERAALASGGTPQASDDPLGWPLATLDFFVDVVRDERLKAALADRYREARRGAGGLVGVDKHPVDFCQEELATVAMALGSGLIIQSAIDSSAVPPDLFGRVMRRLVGE